MNMKSVTVATTNNSLSHSPEIEIIYRALLISHVDVKGEKIDGRQGTATEDLKESREAITLLHVGERVMRGHIGGDDCSRWKFQHRGFEIKEGRKRGKICARSRRIEICRPLRTSKPRKPNWDIERTKWTA